MRKLLLCCMAITLICMTACSAEQKEQNEEMAVTPEVTEELQNTATPEAPEEVQDTTVPEVTDEPQSSEIPPDTAAPTVEPEEVTAPPKEAETPAPSESTPAEEYTSTDKEYLSSIALGTECTKIGQMMEDGTIDGYVLGYTKFLVWKSVATGIGSVGETQYAVLNHNGDFEGDFFSYDVETYRIEHFGSDVFKIGYNGTGTEILYHNLITGKTFYVPFFPNMPEGFSDGFAIALSLEEVKDDDGYYEVILIGDNGDIIRTGVYWCCYGYRWTDKMSPVINGIGRYGDGVFLVSDAVRSGKSDRKNAFYDKNGTKVLDLGDVELNNDPYFVDGYCWIEYVDNGSVWGAYMDINGNFVSGPDKMYDVN